MSDFSVARTNMVDGQIQTAGVVNPLVLQAFETVPREKFVPAALQNVAYAGEDLPIGEGRFLLDPMIHARMIEAAAPNPADVVLDIGGVSGYSAAILSYLATTVVALEEKQKYLSLAEKLWAELDVCNVVGIKGNLSKGNPENAPFNLIFMNGSVSEIPEQIAAQLAPDGRLITIVKKPGAVMGCVTLVQNTGDKGFSSYPLFEAGCPYLPGFEPGPVFSF